jgi:hypothetical protein
MKKLSHYISFLLLLFSSSLAAEKVNYFIAYTQQENGIVIENWDGYEPTLGLNFSQIIDYCTSTHSNYSIPTFEVYDLTDLQIKCYDRDGNEINEVPLILSIESLGDIFNLSGAEIYFTDRNYPYIRLWAECIYERSGGSRFTFPIIFLNDKAFISKIIQP